MIKNMKIGEERQYRRTISKEEVLLFGQITKDMNPAHFDEAFCKTTIFKKPIVHGMLIGSLFSTIFGTDYPGRGTIYCGQTLKFLKPIYPDTEIFVKATIKEIIIEKNRVIFTTEIFNEHQELCLTGEATLMPRKDESNE
jgi:3-hydroxybutyryl-CoA dehydratase